MKTTNMKTISANMIKVSLLVIFTSLLPLTNAVAQKKLYYANSGAPIEVGDSVRINPDSLRYETGETKIKRVYNEVHEIMQVSSKYHPDAVLLRGIYSWIYATSILPENVAKKPIPDPVYTSVEATVDFGTSYTWNDSVYTQTGEYTQKFTAVSGADSTVTLHLTVLPPKPVYTSFDATVEYGQTYTWNEVTYDTTGVYTQNLVAANGADSIVTLNLTVLPEPEPQAYQVDRFSIGVRGGFASTLASAKGLPLGYDVLLDLRYAHYWIADEAKPYLGIMTGLSAGYVQTYQGINPYLDEFVLPTDAGDVRYVVTADNILETTRQIQLEVPVMFSMVTPKGFFLNVGPKLILPVYTTFSQTITNPNIHAYVPELNGTSITNEVVMGKVTDEQANLNGSFNNEWKVSLALAAELGYEFKFKNGHSLDLGVYADYSVYSMYTKQGEGKVITITPPSVNGAAVVDVQSITGANANKFGFFDAGLKVAYNFDFQKKK